MAARQRKKREKTPRADRAAAKVAAGVPKALRHLLDDDGEHERPVFSFSLVDAAYRGEWGWHLLTDAEAKKLLDFIVTISGHTWSDVWKLTGAGGHRLHHNQPISRCCDAAQARLATDRYSQLGGDLVRFALGSTQRLWGYKFGGMFYVVWWDPHHKVYQLD